MTFTTADLYDEYEERLQSCDLQLRQYGARRFFAGPVVTLRCREDNALVKQVLNTPGEGRVLVVDGGGSLRCGLVGGNLAVAAARNGWAGIVVSGGIRDSVAIDDLPIGIKALGTNPRKSGKTGAGTVDAAVEIGGVAIASGQILHSDEDGIVVLP